MTGRRLVIGTVDVVVYVLVLTLFVRHFPAVLSESFTLSVLTALLLKGVLELVLAVKARLRSRFAAAEGATGKVLAALALWAVLFGSKFVVLEAVYLAFGDTVALGGFFSVTVLVVVLILARQAVRTLLTPARAPTAR